MKYKIWDKQETLITPIGEVLTPEQVIARYPAAALPTFKHVIADQPYSLAVWYEFSAMKERAAKLGLISDDMTDQDVLDAITAYEENPPAVEVPLTAEERIAAALEFQNLLSLEG